MRVFRIPKGNGKVRVIYAPSREEKRACRTWLPHLNKALESLPYRVKDAIHGFRRGRSSVTNAWAHRDRAHTVSFDIASFFDSITLEHICHAFFAAGLEIASVAREDSGLTVDGAPRQGLPTSPAIANLVAAAIDADILEALKGDRTAVYSRYADDLTVSTNRQETVDAMLRAVPEIVARHGFQIAEHKTRVQHASAGRRVITGVAVDREVHPTRRMKRRLRAAEHQHNTPQAAGLSEWTRCRLPKAYMPELAKMLAQLAAMLHG